jgi:hypothetical protein
MTPLILIPGSSYRWMAFFTSRTLHTRKRKVPTVQLDEGFGRHQSRSLYFAGVGTEIPLFCKESSHYTSVVQSDTEYVLWQINCIRFTHIFFIV